MFLSIFENDNYPEKISVLLVGDSSF
jgi:hypothetical protein